MHFSVIFDNAKNYTSADCGCLSNNMYIIFFEGGGEISFIREMIWKKKCGVISLNHILAIIINTSPGSWHLIELEQYIEYKNDLNYYSIKQCKTIQRKPKAKNWMGEWNLHKIFRRRFDCRYTWSKTFPILGFHKLLFKFVIYAKPCVERSWQACAIRDRLESPTIFQ